MKIFPSLGLITLCAAFSGCAAGTQNINFVPSTPDQDGVAVVLDGKEIGTAPFSYQIARTKAPAVLKLEFKKNGYRTEEGVLESVITADGLYSFIDEVPVPELSPASAQETVDVTAPSDDTPGVAENDTGVIEEENAPVVDEPEPVPAAEEPTPAPVPAAVPAEEPESTIAESEEELEITIGTDDTEPKSEPAPATEDEPAPEPAANVVPAEPTDSPAPKAENPEKGAILLDRHRTLKDIQDELNNLAAQRQSGQISEKEFQKLCAELEKEVRLRYGSK